MRGNLVEQALKVGEKGRDIVLGISFLQNLKILDFFD